jgi:arginine decarboxylase
VAAAMMERRAAALVEESILEGAGLPPRHAQGGRRIGNDWWFKGARTSWPKTASTAKTGMLKANERWHGFGDLADGFNLLDPIKATIITPGLDVDGEFSERGIPAAIVTKYLAEHGIIVEKTGLYSFFIMFTIGITKGRWNRW